ncbi:hypothetical protein GOODEAATRI_032373 [Goodea atripinnis]|uniref:Uncharacterized protein n=1 Tax=Goodea atripinnis TaxID=208336 RepID=A0ABV0NPY1_9TELE
MPRSPSSLEGGQTVINLSKHFVLSTEQLSLLNRGLTFVPTKGCGNRWLEMESSRGYQRSFLRRCLKGLPESQTERGGPLLPFLATFSPINIELSKVLKRNFIEFQSSSGRLAALKVISAFRRNKNLQDMLVHAKVGNSLPHSPHLAVQHGQNFRHQKWLQNPVSHTVYSVPQQGSPWTTNCVFLISCKVCTFHFVGETANTLCGRLLLFQQNVRRNTPRRPYRVVESHFITHSWEAAQVMLLQHDHSWTRSQRTKAATIWGARLGTALPTALAW